MDNIFFIVTFIKISVFFGMMFSLSLFFKKYLSDLKNNKMQIYSIFKNDKKLFLLNVFFILAVIALCFI